MTIGVDCPGCRTTFQVDPKHAGRLGKCPLCQERVRVPHLAPAPSPTPKPARSAPTPAQAPKAPPRRPIVDLDDDGEEDYGLASEAAAEPAPAKKPGGWARTPREILAAFCGTIEPVPTTAEYRAWIAVVAVVMLILPVIYFGLVALVGAGVAWMAVHNLRIFEAGVNKLTLLFYVAPVFTGVVVVGFMLKPFLAPLKGGKNLRRIDPNKEPLLVAFVDGVCGAVGAPIPSRIEVDCEVNASARLASWVISPSRELVLTIGLPLVAGLSLRQFTGVLAHEFGHFSQGAGMRLTVVIWTINRWFAQVVYQRDEWDEALLRWSSREAGWWMIFGLAIRGAVWATRRVLWLLMQAGRLVSGFLSRQMEFDADRYETRMVGGPTFKATSERLRALGLAAQAAHTDLAGHWRERRLPDDVARLIGLKVAEFPADLLKAVADEALARRTGVFDTHPCDSERITRALLEESPGIFQLDGPATDLFRDFDALARATTFDFYQAILGPEVSPGQLYPVAEAVLNREAEREGNQAIGRYFLDAWQLVQPLPLPDAAPRPPRDPGLARRELGEARRGMLARRPVNRELAERWGKTADRLVKAGAAGALLHAGKKVRPAVVDLDRLTPATVRAAQGKADAALDYILTEMEPYAALAARRLTLALGLLDHDAVVGRVADGAVLRDEAALLYPVAAHLGGAVIPELGRAIPALGTLGFLINLFAAGKNEQDMPLIQAMLAASRATLDRLAALRGALGDAIAYPFEHAEPGITLGRYALPALPPAEAVGAVLAVATEAQDRVLDLHRRALGRLVATAEAVERAVGLPPLAVAARSARREVVELD